jgi:hypothetical protein
VDQAVNEVIPFDIVLISDVAPVPPSSVATKEAGTKTSHTRRIVTSKGELGVDSLHANATTGDAPGEAAHA